MAEVQPIKLRDQINWPDCVGARADGRTVHLPRQSNAREFSTPGDAQAYVKIYISLAAQAMYRLAAAIEDEGRLVRGVKTLDDLKMHVSTYFLGGCEICSEDSTQRKVDDMYALRNDINLLQRLGVLED